MGQLRVDRGGDAVILIGRLIVAALTVLIAVSLLDGMMNGRGRGYSA